jgi:drug/metabolite transporter (DMT)-like permease
MNPPTPQRTGATAPSRVGASRSVHALGPAAALVAVTAVWGSTFVVIKDVTQTIPVADFLAVRFAIAAAVLWLLAPRSVARLGPVLRRRALVLGAVYGVAQLLQTWGLAMVSASVSGFLTGLYVVLTPVIAAVLLRESVARATWLAVGLATVGLAVLSLDGLAIGVGELLTVASAAAYALHIVLLGAWSKPGHAVGLAVLQMAVISVVCGVAAVPGGVVLPSTSEQWWVMLYIALVAGALAMLTQTWAQARLPATRAAIIMTTEPVFASTFGVLVDGDPLTPRFVLGAAFVLAAMYTAELGPRGAREGAVAHLPGE